MQVDFGTQRRGPHFCLGAGRRCAGYSSSLQVWSCASDSPHFVVRTTSTACVERACHLKASHVIYSLARFAWLALLRFKFCFQAGALAPLKRQLADALHLAKVSASVCFWMLLRGLVGFADASLVPQRAWQHRLAETQNGHAL